MSMRVGTVKELETGAHWIGISPSSVRELEAGGHAVLVETSAEAAIGYNDEAYLAAEASIEPDAEAVFAPRISS
jgi:alanine dehydrogenase